MQHLFDIDIAKKYGVNVAIFIKNIAYWVSYNQANNKHLYDGRYWTFNTLESFSQIFPYWTVKQIRTIINHALSNNLLMKGEYNKLSYDKTLWYSLTDLGHQMLNLAICPNGQMDVPERADRSDQKGTPIPDNKHINKPYKSRGERVKSNAPTSLSLFEPDKQNQELARRIGVDLAKEVKSFIEKHKGPKTQKAFEQWLQHAKDYKERTQRTSQTEVRSTVPEYRGSNWDKPQAKPETTKKYMGEIMKKLGRSHGRDRTKSTEGLGALGGNGQIV